MPLQIRRGYKSELDQITPSEGELIYVKPVGLEGQKLYIGDGTTPGSLLTPVTGYSDSEAVDAIGAALDGGTHSGISFTTDTLTNTISAEVDFASYQGTINAASFKGSVFADDSTLLVDAVAGFIPAEVVQGTFTGYVEGGLTGTLDGPSQGFHTGDMKGSVFADDSTILVDAVDGVLRGTLIGNVTGTHTGNVVTDSITADGSSIAFAGNLEISGTIAHGTPGTQIDFTTGIISREDITLEADLNLQGSIINPITEEFIVDVGTTLIQGGTVGTLRTVNLGGEDSSFGQGSGVLNVRGASITGSSIPAGVELFASTALASGGSRLTFNKARNNSSNTDPTTVSVSDYLGQLDFLGHDGTAFRNSASIVVTASSVSSGIVGGAISFNVTDSSGSSESRLRVLSDGVTVGPSQSTDGGSGRLEIHHTENTGTRPPLMLTCYDNSAADVANIVLRRTRGTRATPAAVQSGDDLFEILGLGLDTTGSATSFRTAVGVTAIVDGTPTATYVPGALQFTTTNTAGTLATRMKLTNAGTLQVDTVSAYNANTPFYVSSMLRMVSYSNETSANAAVGGTPTAGMMYFDTGASKAKVYDGSAWQTLW